MPAVSFACFCVACKRASMSFSTEPHAPAKPAPETKPVVRVRAERRRNDVRLWVEDNGIGIKPEYQHRLFSVFERVHQEKNYEGTGIGLAIVRKAAERTHEATWRRACVRNDNRCRGLVLLVALGAWLI